MQPFNYLSEKPYRFFLLAATLWFIIMCCLNSLDGSNFQWHDLLVEANGLVFDLLVFGVLLSIYEELRTQKEKIERLHKEIDDFRGWDEKEATYRIVGSIKRLNDLGITKIDLHDCFLPNAVLRNAKFQGSNLSTVNFSGANLDGCDFTKAQLDNADFNNSSLMRCNFFESYCFKANFKNSNLRNAIFRQANIQNANFNEAAIQGIDRTGAKESNSSWENVRTA
jgi:BTB/POZ domain-containing protein KCTD9